MKEIFEEAFGRLVSIFIGILTTVFIVTAIGFFVAGYYVGSR